MMTRRALALLFPILFAGCAHQAGLTSVEDILALEEQRTAAVIAEDHVTLDRFHTEDFLRIQPHQATDRNTLLNEHRQKTREWRKLDREDVKVRFIHDDVAIVTGRVRYELMDGSRLVNGHNRFTHVWVRRDGRWQVASAHYGSAE